ncbi:MAG TPA: hypothetical protein VM262_08495 [Acidimicrobiales bacterium]|nr:hypothetical protein [Acidimicrobiales bacterium]
MARRVVIGLLLLAAVGAFWAAGIHGTTEQQPILTQGAVEAFIPAPNSPSVVRQAEIGIDLAEGWTGELVINGIPIPDDQLRRNDPLNQLFFTPGEGREIERLDAGQVTVVARIWRPVDGETREQAREVSWSFAVV